MSEAIQYGIKACEEINDFIKEIQRRWGRKGSISNKKTSLDEKPT